jgi:hypothetical protein
MPPETAGIAVQVTAGAPCVERRSGKVVGIGVIHYLPKKERTLHESGNSLDTSAGYRQGGLCYWTPCPQTFSKAICASGLRCREDCSFSRSASGNRSTGPG